MSGLERKWVLSVCAHLCSRVCLKCRVYMPLGASFFEDVPLVEFMYLVFNRMPGERYRSRLRSLFYVTKSNKRTEDSFESKSLPFCLTFQSTFSSVGADWSAVCATCFPLAIPSPMSNMSNSATAFGHVLPARQDEKYEDMPHAAISTSRGYRINESIVWF